MPQLSADVVALKMLSATLNKNQILILQDFINEMGEYHLDDYKEVMRESLLNAFSAPVTT